MPRKQNPEPENRELARQLRALSVNLRRFRQGMKPKRWSQQELASAAKLSTTTVHELESVKAVDVRLSTIISLARALDKKVSDLIDAN